MSFRTISFDLDDTILLPSWSGEAKEDWVEVFGYGRCLREGTLELFRELNEEGRAVWIYSSSYRSVPRIMDWFAGHGVSLAGVVNQPLHEQAAEEHWTGSDMPPLKYPPWFGIELHVDDSETIAQLGRQFGFAVLTLAPGDTGWREKVGQAVREGA